ncbi:MAG: peptidase, partial [Planctomycetota bacterium]
FYLATDGAMRFDSADIGGLSSSSLNALILHEMGHVMGFGTLWVSNGVYTNGTGEYTGTNATAAWQSEFGQSGTPDVELGGGAGTANGHWNEVDGGSALTGIVDSMGRDMRDELMTGWLNPNAFISDMTIQSFVDIGFVAAAIPEPSGMLLISFVVVVGNLLNRTRKFGFVA